MKKIFLLLTLALTLMGQTVVLAANNMAAMYKPLVEMDFYAVNDFQGHIGANEKEPGALRLSGSMQELIKKNPYATVVMAGGNTLSGSAENDKRKGDPTILMLNSMGIIADVAGPKTFDYDASTIAGQASQSYFAYLAANILDESGNVAAPFKPYLMLDRGGVSIGVVGLVSTKATAAAAAKGYKIVPPEQVAQQCINELRQHGAKLVILLTSLGSQGQGLNGVSGEITGLLDQVTGVDGVFTTGNGAASAGTYKNIPVAQGEPFGKGLGQLHFLYDRDGKKVLAGNAQLVDTMTLPAETDSKLAKNFEKMMSGMGVAAINAGKYAPKAHKPLKTSIYRDVNPVAAPPKKGGETLAECVTPLSNYPGGQSTVGEYFTGLLQQAFKADVVLYPGSAFKYGLDAGKITTGTLEGLFGTNPKVLVGELSGADIRAAVEHGLNPGIGIIRYAGLKVQGNISKAEGGRISNISLADGSSLIPTKLYKVVLPETMVQGAEGYSSTKSLKNYNDQGPQLDFFKFALKAYKTVNYTSDNRLRF